MERRVLSDAAFEQLEALRDTGSLLALSSLLRLPQESFNASRTEMITNENLEILFRFRFRNGKAKKLPPDFLLHLLS